MSDFDPVILIHGAWQGSWAWARFMPYLEAAGLSAHAVDLPGNGADGSDPADVTFEACLQHVHRIVGALGRPVSLVGHSGGGLLITAFAERWPQSVSRLVYVVGMMLPDGTGFEQLVTSVRPRHPEASGIWPYLEWSADRKVSRVPAEAAIAIFLHDCPESDAAAAAAQLTPQGEGGRAVTTPATAERYGRIPRLYVEALQDRSVILPVQRAMQALAPGASVVSLPTGHAPQFSVPARLAEAIIPFLTSAM
ncbi:alpha/beta hydrolase [Bradyrhizobium sp. dw_78]|uniref:alpha/beta fold hydrolase n=1 Tax=Bradyrhizobium sp. dw_78 TaxID=2719793 RepID=UPI001BD5654B|nr:alpha/beta hydrolase [Bradyrhizobium sp. dw_78]